jgi:hypothetical protein
MKKFNILQKSGLIIAAICISMYSGAGELPGGKKEVLAIKATMENPAKPLINDNELTAAEKKAGWKLLFDGKTTKGWHTYLKQDVSPKWKVENGALTLTGGGAGDIVTDEEFGDFELELEWKIAEGGNSGIMYHVHEDPKFNATYATGPEVQVLDDARHPDAKQGKNGNRVAGSLYDMLPPTKNATKPAGQFNKVRIVIKDGKAEHYMNGTKIVEYPTTGPEWDKMVEDSKFKGWEGFGKYNKGHIALQDHGNVVTFKNIKIRPL